MGIVSMAEVTHRQVLFLDYHLAIIPLQLKMQMVVYITQQLPSLNRVPPYQFLRFRLRMFGVTEPLPDQ